MKRKIGLLLFLIFIVSITISLMFVKKMHVEEGFSSSMAIMVYDESEGTYVKANEIPKGRYELNNDLSKCDSGGTIGEYDSASGTIKYTLDTADQCNLYFDISALTLASYIKDDVYTEDGMNDLYFHDGKGTYANANLEIGDNSYRYSGVDPANYVCFDGDDCTKEENLYRIISINGNTNQTKVVKAKSINDLAWNTSKTNTWEGSSLEMYLNNSTNGYLYNLGEKVNLIDDATWNVGGFSDTERQNNNAKGIYNIETASTPKTTKSQKIGLLYVYEYLYAASPEHWSKNGYNMRGASLDYRSAFTMDWLYKSNYPWTISRYSNTGDNTFRISNVGYIDFSTSNNIHSVYPTFNLKSSVKIINANSDNVGTKTEPMLLA